MKTVLGRVLGSWFLLGCLVYAADPADAKLLMYLPFDGNAQAGQSVGEAAPVEEEKLLYGPGVKGQAVEFSQGTRLAYARPGNLRQEEGTILFWFKPDWSLADEPHMTLERDAWHCLFSEPRPEDHSKLAGAGTLWFWFWGQQLRGDIGLYKGAFKTTTVPMEAGVWQHLAFAWSVRGQLIYYNGQLVADATQSLKGRIGDDGKPLAFDPDRFDTFFLGNHKGKESADGWMDEFKIYDRVLSPKEIRAEFAEILPVKVVMKDCYLQPKAERVRWEMRDVRGTGLRGRSCTYAIRDSAGTAVADGGIKLDLAPGENEIFSAPIALETPGGYELELVSDEVPARLGAFSDTFYILDPKNRFIGQPGSELKTTKILSVHIPDLVGGESYTDVGETRKCALDGQEYMEAGPELHDRFAIHLSLPEDNVPYWVEWTYPDDKRRTLEVVMQSAGGGSSEYMYHTGVFCGDEYPNTGKMQTFKAIYWARSRDVAMIFMTTADGAPAAAADVTVSRIDGPLPPARLDASASVADGGRTFGIYFEDPAITYDFGETNSLMPGFEKTLDKLVAYMEWTGQDFLAYPGVWYGGLMGDDGYNPRAHPKDFIRLILTKFAPYGLSFMPTINLHDIPLPDDIPLSKDAVADGSLYNTPVMIHSDGKGNPGKFHNSPPLYNPLHPRTQETVNGYVDEMLARYGDSPSFKGIILHLTEHTTPWFGSIRSGYNDYNIEQFEKDTGIEVPVPHTDPLRGKFYYEWLTANACEPWVEWRCRKMSEWYLAIAKRIAAKRADLKLGIFTFCPKPYYDAIYDEQDRYGQSGSTLAFNREAGFDPALYRDAENVVISQTITPADYRHSERRGAGSFRENHPDIRERMRDIYYKPDTYTTLTGAKNPWLNMFDFYFEDAIGRVQPGQKVYSVKKPKPLVAPWLKETGWRVSTLNANGDYFLLHFLLPLRYEDVLGITKGGFLIGTLGMEDKLREFAAAYRPLPAKRFTDMRGTGGTLTVRSLKQDGATWFYVVNSGPESAEVDIVFATPPKAVKDLSSGQPVTPADGRLRLTLSRYQLRSFRAEGEVDIDIAK